ncbi:TrbG/VirB9 family P-type conjugative transfer protein [Brevundimonas sp.]|uniref:TrbG/VirB9 family P-type conjugative transfer protein n=1 Tax=Brevundimonas sp. TaxID=1871086 RepID=UPI0028A21764|nr:TrbG/VirB9 family P-type conjugative transfer protein [Brevundimonas sp.]
MSKAAGDTVRWQIGEVTSGAHGGRQTHVVLKPLQRGLDTNLVLTTNKRVYLIDLKSGPVEGFNPAVAWTFGLDAVLASSSSEAVRRPESEPAPVRPEPVVLPEGEPDGRYRIEPQGRKARWTPTAVFNDGRRTFITFDPDLQVDEAPALFMIAPDGERQLVNYRQVGGLFVVDRVFDRAELRLGDRRPQVVVLRRMPGAPT